MNVRVSIEHWRRWQVLAAGAAAYVVSRVIARASGIYFDDSSLVNSWQHLDPELLQHRLFESLLYLHAQAPAFNAFLGIVLKLAGSASHSVFEALFLAMGATLYVVLFCLMRRLQVSRAWAFAVSTVFVISPSYILYEHWLFYTLPLALLVCVAALCFVLMLERNSPALCAAFFVVVGVLCCMHGIFHLIYLIACVVGLLAARCLPARVVLASAALPFVLVFGLYLKNAVLFGQFTTSTWVGMNAALRRVDELPLAERERLVAAGKLSDVARVTPFSPLKEYPAHYALVSARFGSIPALSEAEKHNGQPNLNHVGYIEIAKQYSRDTRFVVTHYPGVLLKSLVRGWNDYFKPSSEYIFLDPNIKASPLMRSERHLFDVLLYGVPGHGAPGIVLLIGIPLVVAYALRAARRPGISVEIELTRERRLLLLFCAATIVFVALVANSLNALENMRIRFMTDPLIATLVAFWAQAWLAPFTRRLRAGARAIDPR